jgi:signal peptidase I
MEKQSLTATLKKLWKNEYFHTAVTIGLIALVFLSVWYGSQAVLNTPYPVSAVESGSMCVPYGARCDGWTHPFDHTLHIGDLIIVQGVNPEDLNADYPDSDIIVFHKPTNPNELIVHRIIAVEEIDGTLYFQTKGDGNGNDWPATPEHGIDHWSGYPDGVPEDLVVGKVIMRVPWVGHLPLFMRNGFGIPLVIVIIVLIVIYEFVLPLFRKKPENDNAVDLGNVKKPV